MLTPDIYEQLKAPFPPEDHSDRVLPGGGKWVYIPWQKSRDRLSEVCPNWECAYSDPLICGDLTVIRCRLTIEGVTREGVGNSEAYPDKKRYGSPIELARADAFKEAAEQFGIGAYIDDQPFVAQYLRGQGDYRAAGYMAQNQKAANPGYGRLKQPLAGVHFPGGRRRETATPAVSQSQLTRLYAIANQKKLDKLKSKQIIAQFGYESSKDIQQKDYEAIVAAIQSA